MTLWMRRRRISVMAYDTVVSGSTTTAPAHPITVWEPSLLGRDFITKPV
jgi:hypothetical protein